MKYLKKKNLSKHKKNPREVAPKKQIKSYSSSARCPVTFKMNVLSSSISIREKRKRKKVFKATWVDLSKFEMEEED